MAKYSSNFFESSSIQSSYERIEASQFSMAILERETSAQLGEHARRARRSFLAAWFIRLATETTGGKIVVAFWPKHSLRSDLRAPNFKNLPGGACPQTPLACSHVYIHPSSQWPYQSKIAASSPIVCINTSLTRYNHCL